jgi:hypothetical protein
MFYLILNFIFLELPSVGPSAHQQPNTFGNKPNPSIGNRLHRRRRTRAEEVFLRPRSFGCIGLDRDKKRLVSRGALNLDSQRLMKLFYCRSVGRIGLDCQEKVGK